MKTIKLIFISIAMLANFSLLNATSEKGVAKVIKMRGQVFLTQTSKAISKGDWIPEGAKITTKSRSFVKLLFIDKSKLTLGANSEMEVQQFPKKEAGIINLINGQLRSKVSKNYLQIDKKKSKLFIKTKTAAMGVRGTDFQVNYNPVNQNTTLITFEGAVAMGSLTKFKKSRGMRQDRLEKVVSAPTSVMVKRGQLSGVMPAIDSKPISPVKINKKQLKALEANDGSKVSSEKKEEKSKKAMSRNIIPPGVDSKSFAASGNKEIADQMAKIDKGVRAPASQNEKSTQSVASNGPEKKGALKDGGYVDTENALYIPPPKNAPVDPTTKETIVPIQMGSFDKATGEYTNDFYKVDEEGNFVAKEEDTTLREPASTTDTTMTTTTMNVYDMMDDQMAEDTKIESTITREISSTTDGSTVTTDDSKMMEETMDDRDLLIDQTATKQDIINRAKVNIILNKVP